MGEPTETTNADDERPDLGLHPLASEKKPEASEDPIRKAIAIIIDRATPRDHLAFLTPELFRTIHLAFPDYEKTQKISLMIKRSPEMKIFYPKIRKWFASQELEWRDSSVNKDRYMRVDIGFDEDEIHRLIQSAHDDIFGVQATRATAIDSLHLSYDLMGLRHPVLMLISGFALIASLVFLPMYEVYKLNTLSAPSIYAIDWLELFLILNFFLCIAALRYCDIDKKRKNSMKRWKRNLGRVAVLGVIGMTFFTF